MGLALGLGGLAKPPIIFIAGPILLLTLILSGRKIIKSPKPIDLVKAAGLAFIVMLPWWAFNFKAALVKAFRSGGYVRHSLGTKGSLEALTNWFNVFTQSMLGTALALLALAIVATFALQLFHKQLKIEQATVSAIAVCFAGALPMLLMSTVSTNQNARLIAPTLLPLAVAIGAIAALTRWTTSKWLAAIATAAIAVQLVAIVSPTPGEPRYQTGDTASQKLLWGNPTMVMRRIDQWDWSGLREICQDHHIKSPLITYLGNDQTFNPPQIAFPWVRSNEDVKVKWLWQYVEGEIDWNKILESINASNVVLTVPNLIGEVTDNQHLDNQHNAELIQRLQQMPDFSEPIKLKMGRFKPVEVFVFLRQQPPAAPSIPPTGLADLF